MTGSSAVSPSQLSFFKRLLVPILRFYIKLVYSTTKWEHLGPEETRDAIARGDPLIIAFWHGRMLIMPVLKPKGYKAHMLISNNRHGSLVAEVIRVWNAPSIRGSTRNPKKTAQDKGGREALADIKRATNRGDAIGITPDGPRGPRMRVQKGVATIAQMTGLPVCGVTYATRWRKILGSWDGFHLAFPFGRGTIVWSLPLTIDRELDAGEACRRIEEIMIEGTRQADLASGHIPVEPGSPRED